MRKKRTVQSSIFDFYSDHEIGKELKAVSEFLDAHPEFLEWVEMDLYTEEVFDTGRHGLSSETVLRCALLKQLRQLTYKELEFHLSDSASFQAFARLSNSAFPKKSALQNTISRILISAITGLLRFLRRPRSTPSHNNSSSKRPFRFAIKTKRPKRI